MYEHQIVPKQIDARTWARACNWLFFCSCFLIPNRPTKSKLNIYLCWVAARNQYNSFKRVSNCTSITSQQVILIQFVWLLYLTENRCVKCLRVRACDCLGLCTFSFNSWVSIRASDDTIFSFSLWKRIETSEHFVCSLVRLFKCPSIPLFALFCVEQMTMYV